MWNFAKKFIPGMHLEPEEDEETNSKKDDESVKAKSSPNMTIVPKSPTDSLENSFVFLDEEGLEETGSQGEEDEMQIFIKPFRPKKKPAPDVIKGTDWESVNYDLKKIECQEDEVTGIAVSESFIVAQYYIEPDIDVFDRKSSKNEVILSLKGHEYGGGNLVIVEDRYLYSASMDRSTICWDLKNGGRIIGQTQGKNTRFFKTIFCFSFRIPRNDNEFSPYFTDHFDYINTLFANGQYVLTGGKGDKLIFVYEARSLTLKYKLEGHTGWITELFVGQDDILFSASADKTIKTWNLSDGSLLRTYEEDAGISAMIPSNDLILFGDEESKLSFLNTASGETLHLLPNILIGTGRYIRSSKYHDKGIDNMYLTDNGYLITASSGSKYVKIWKFTSPFNGDWERTDVKELQILRDHADYLTALRVYDNKIYSSCSDGNIYVHEFPIGQRHYDMAEEQEKDLVNNVSLSANGAYSETPKNPTELCMGGFRCRTGKTGIAKSSSSFMVSFQLRPAVEQVKENIRLSTIIIPEEESTDEWNPSSDSDEYELVIETESSDSEEDGE